MTRLKTEWVEYMIDGMTDYNTCLKRKTGFDLGGLMKHTFRISDSDLEKAKKCNKVAVVPITQGEGIIGSFSESIAAIIKSTGFDARVTAHTDVDGIYDGILQGCNIFFFADDTRYLALNIANNKASDNNYATALGFIEVLSLLMKHHGKQISQEKILQIGCGIVGKEAAKILTQRSIDFVLYDKDPAATEVLSCRQLVQTNQIKDYHYILDFTNEGNWLHKELLSEDLLYASPGVPYSMDDEAAKHFEDRAIHDNLEIGTVIMLGEVVT